MKTLIIKNHRYSTGKSESSDTFDFATFFLTPEFLRDINDAINLAEREYQDSLHEYRAAREIPRLKPLFNGLIYSDPNRLTYFNRDSIEKLISLQAFDEAEDSGHIEVIYGDLPEIIAESIPEEGLYTAGATLEIQSNSRAFRWRNKPIDDDECILLTDWIYLDNEHLTLEDESDQLDNGDLYFKSEAARIIFALTRLHSDELCNELRITKRLYCKRNRKKADEWYESLAQIIHPATCTHPDAKKAFAKLKNLHERMTSS
jgi:hypothetical protein